MTASLPVRIYRFWLKEVTHILPPTLYFFIAFNLITFTTNLLVAPPADAASAHKGPAGAQPTGRDDTA